MLTRFEGILEMMEPDKSTAPERSSKYRVTRKKPPTEAASPVQAAQLSVKFPTMVQLAIITVEPLVSVLMLIDGYRPGPNLK
jgi:hypothetical protein